MLGDPVLSSMGAGALRPKMSTGGSAREGESGRDMKYKGFFKRAFSPSAPESKLHHENDLGKHAVTMAENQILNSLQVTEEQLDSWRNRRRRTFINHTPRNHEPYHGTESTSAQQAVYQDRSEDRPSNHMDESDRNSHLILPDAVLHELDVPDSPPAELDSKEVTPALPECGSPTSGATSKGEAANGIDTEMQAQTIASEYRPLHIHKSSALRAGGKEEATHKSIQSPARSLSASTQSHSTAAAIARHSPLEPLVARHRREITGSDVDVLPPHVDIGDIDDTVTFMPDQEYSNHHGQDQDLSLHFFSGILADRIDRICRNAAVDQVSDCDNEGGAVGSPPLHNAVYPSDGVENRQSPASQSPSRNLERKNAPLKCGGPAIRSRSDEDLDFLSAAEGCYSPYHCEAYGPVTPPHRVVSKPRSSSSSQEKYSFNLSTPRHELLISDGQLDDLNYFLRNTGPPTMPVKPLKRKAFGFGVLGKKGVRHQAQGAPSPKEGVPPVPSLPPMLAVCAREEKTKNGTRYVKILTPGDHDLHDQMESSLIIDESQQSKSSVNCVWTQEMFNPLGSAPVEDAIAGYASSSASDSSPSDSQKTVVRTRRGPKPARRLPARVPVNSHPLAATRQDKTRARKLRDLHRGRTTTMLLDYGSEAEYDEDDTTRQRRQKVLVDSTEWVRLQRLNKELTRELATAAGMEENGEGFTPEYVLEVYQMVNRPSYREV